MAGPGIVRVLCIYAPSRAITRNEQVRGHFFERLQNFMEDKIKGNENKIILREFNSAMNKMNGDDGNITRRIYRCCSNYALSKFIVDNGLGNLCYCSPLWCRIDRVYSDMKFPSNTKINHKMVSFTDHYSDIYIDILSPKTKIGTNLISQLQKICFLIKKKFSASGWWEYTKSCFNENKSCKISSTKENIRVLKLEKRLWRLSQKESFNEKPNQRLLATYMMNFIN